MPLQNDRVTCLRITALVVGLAFAAQAALGGEGRGSPGPTLIFLTKSDACECVRSLCITGEQEVINFMAANPYGFRLEKVDLADNSGAEKTYRAITLPVAILLDAQGRETARFDSFFTEGQLIAAWEEHLQAVEGKP